MAVPRTVLVFGDSLSAAFNMPIEQGWVQLLDHKLAESHAGQWRVVNASVSGETTAGGLARLPAALASQRPALVLIALGANDGLRGLQLPQMRANLMRMIELSRDGGAKVALIGIELPGNYGQAYRGRFRQVYTDLAEQFGIPLLPFLLEGIAEDLSSFQEDQIHPTAAAQPRIRDHVYTWLAPQLR
ncbi:MAG: Esterase TesA [Xanthomonadales bacterium]|nr:Esterase TesA [Xanthomonadales bacterium]